MRQLGTDQVGDLYPIPFLSDEQVLTGRKRLDALGEALDEILGIFGGGLTSDRPHGAEQVLAAMIELAHEEMHLLLALACVR
jgi:hypothetical protein